MAELKCLIDNLEEDINRGSFKVDMWDEDGSEMVYCLVDKDLLDEVLDYLCAKRDGRKPIYTKDGLPDKIVCCKDCMSASDMGDKFCMCKTTHVVHEEDFWCKAGKERPNGEQ